MNIEELETKLRRLEAQRPSAGFAERVLGQRPADPTDKVGWWRRRVSVPVPALAAAVILVVVIQVALWNLANPHPDAIVEPSATPALLDVQPVMTPTPSVALASASSPGPEVSVTMTGNCSFHLDR